MQRNKSIVQDDMSKCYICGTTQNLHTHEIFFGNSDRKKSIQYGLYVRLCGYHHNQSNDGVHFNKDLNRFFKRLGQIKFEKKYGHDKFMEVFHKNYL